MRRFDSHAAEAELSEHRRRSTPRRPAQLPAAVAVISADDRIRLQTATSRAIAMATKHSSGSGAGAPTLNVSSRPVPSVAAVAPRNAVDPGRRGGLHRHCLASERRRLRPGFGDEDGSAGDRVVANAIVRSGSGSRRKRSCREAGCGGCSRRGPAVCRPRVRWPVQRHSGQLRRSTFRSFRQSRCSGPSYGSDRCAAVKASSSRWASSSAWSSCARCASE
jgi:hypothetical protein